MTAEASILAVAHPKGTLRILQSGSKSLEKSVPAEAVQQHNAIPVGVVGMGTSPGGAQLLLQFATICEGRNLFAKQSRTKTVTRDLNSLFFRALSAKQQIGPGPATETWHSTVIEAGLPMSFKRANVV